MSAHDEVLDPARRSPTLWTAEGVLSALSHGVRPPDLTRDEALAVVVDGIPGDQVDVLDDVPDGTTVTAYGRTFTASTDAERVRWWVCRPGPSPDIVKASSRVLLAHLSVAVVEGPGTWGDVEVRVPDAGTDGTAGSPWARP